MSWSLRRAVFSPLVVVLALAWERDPWFAGRGIRTIVELSPAAAKRLAAEPSTLLLQVGEAEGAKLLPRARLVSAEDPVPGALSGDAQGAVVVLARLPEQGLRLAARIVRHSGRRVAVVTGGLDAWTQERAAGHAPGAHG